MANNLPTFQGGRRVSQSLDSISYNTVASKSANNPFESISMALRNASSHIEDRLDLQAKIEGAKAGTLAGQNGIPDLQAEDTLRGAAFNMAARDAAQTQFELGGITALNEYEKSHEADPQGFTKKADEYWQGISGKLQGFDPAMAQKLGAQYEIRKQNMLSRIEDKARAIARDRQMEGVLRLQMSLQDDLETSASKLYAPDTTPEQRAALLEQMVTAGGQIASSAHHMGPDGRFLFDAGQRIKLEKAGESAVSKSIGMAWLKSQPDLIGAYDAWQKGEAAIEIPDGQGGVRTAPLKELLGTSGYRLAESEFFDNLRSELALQAQVDTAQDRAFKKNSEQLFSDLSVQAQDGQITLKAVEAARSQLEPTDYLALRTMAKSGGASVSDGATLSTLVVRDANGEDVKSDLIKAHEDGKLSTEDFRKYYGQNTTRLRQGMKDPVNAARDSLSQRLGVLSKELGLAQSSAIGQANLSYETEISDFVDKNGRQPNIREASDIAEGVFQRFSAMDVDSSIISLPLPRSMTQAERLDTRLSTASIQQKIKTLTDQKLKDVGGDRTKLADDPDYIQELILLKKYHDLLNLKETGNARPAK
ncbi:MAG: hypothetical protein IAE63_06775 [Alphaproteobacteria bacterium]|nr:hypothetical protein [Alphaproteobacteria bacterium]